MLGFRETSKLLSLCVALLVTGCRDVPSNDACGLGAGDRYRARVIDSQAGGTGNMATDGHAAEGAPDCTDTTGFVSLGAGYLVFDIGCMYPVKAGAELRVWESQMCPGLSETYEVSVSADGQNFVRQPDGRGDSDIDVTGITEFRYVRIDDPDTTVGTSRSPGPDIDALELLHAGR